MAKSPYSGLYGSKHTPQTQRAPGDVGARQVKGRAGGYVFKASDWDRLDRFLILGSSTPTYYASEHTLTRENAQVVLDLLKVDGERVVKTITAVSIAGRAPRNSPALFALALAISFGDVNTRRVAAESLVGVARTASHLFEWLSYVKEMRGFGRVVKRAVESWYNSRGSDTLAYQMLKYKNRYGWTHADVIRMIRPTPATDAHSNLFAWAVGKDIPVDQLPRQVGAVNELHNPGSAVHNPLWVSSMIREYNLVREVVPTEYLNDVWIWEALLEDMPVWALVRNLGKMTSIGLIGPGSDARRQVINKLTNQNYLWRGRVHPLTILQALATYRSGSGYRGSLTWNPDARIIDALDAAFYTTFGNIDPIGNRVLLGLDVSGSMWGGFVGGLAPVQPAVATAAMALVTARTEDNWESVCFSHKVIPFPLSPRQRLDDVLQTMNRIPFGRTDCAIPMLYALENGMSVNTFIIYTDNETWAGRVMHPYQALNLYREKTGIPAKLVVVGMTSNGFSIADPESDYMLDVVGMDTAAPNLIADFARNDG